VLGLLNSATPAEVRVAFRRLVRRYHPDLTRSAANQRRLIEVVHAYRCLQHELSMHGQGVRLRPCPRCGRYGELLDGLDGRPGCVDCLLGQTRWSGYLPAPLIQIVRHVPVLLLYSASTILAGEYIGSGRSELALGSLGLTIVALLTLALTCMRVKDVA
jgi:hypothetical protein